jgi:AcrR family transcriptional regulator
MLPSQVRVGRDAPAGMPPALGYERLKPGPGRSLDEVRSDQRDRIHRAMVEIVAAGGYSSVTVRKLTRLAGVSTGAFYAQFNGKDEAFVATYAQLMSSSRGRIATIRSADRRREDQLSDALRALLDGPICSSEGRKLALVEVFAAGPAAAATARREETALERVVKAVLDRRQNRVPRQVVGWILAGAMRLATSHALHGGSVRIREVEELRRWCNPYLDSAPSLRAPAVTAWSVRGGQDGTGAPTASSERDLILTAALRLSRERGFWHLSIPSIRRVAGISAAAFRQNFKSATECYLAALDRVSGRYLDSIRRIDASASSPTAWAKSVYREMLDLCDQVAADSANARMLFLHACDPGVEGLRWRESAVAEWGTVWSRASPPDLRLSPVATDATIAALWGAFADGLAAGDPATVRGEAATYVYFLLAPVVGSELALAVTRERPHRNTAVSS